MIEEYYAEIYGCIEVQHDIVRQLFKKKSWFDFLKPVITSPMRIKLKMYMILFFGLSSFKNPFLIIFEIGWERYFKIFGIIIWKIPEYGFCLSNIFFGFRACWQIISGILYFSKLLQSCQTFSMSHTVFRLIWAPGVQILSQISPIRSWWVRGPIRTTLENVFSKSTNWP